MNTAEKLNFLQKHAKHNVNLAAASYRLIQSAPEDERPHLLEQFFLGAFARRVTRVTLEDFTLPVFITVKERAANLAKYRDLANKKLKELQRQNLENDEFYRQLWSYLSDSPEFPNIKSRILALYSYMRNIHLPYSHLDLDSVMQMSDEDFADIEPRIRPVIAKVKYILKNDLLNQYSQISYLLLQELNSFENDRERCLLLAIILRMLL